MRVENDCAYLSFMLLGGKIDSTAYEISKYINVTVVLACVRNVALVATENGYGIPFAPV